MKFWRINKNVPLLLFLTHKQKKREQKHDTNGKDKKSYQHLKPESFKATILNPANEITHIKKNKMVRIKLLRKISE